MQYVCDTREADAPIRNVRSPLRNRIGQESSGSQRCPARCYAINPVYIREGEIQRPNPGFVVPFHGLVSFLFVARDNIQKDAVSSRLVVYIVPPALIFRPPAHLTAHGPTFSPGTRKTAIERCRVRPNKNRAAACPEAARVPLLRRCDFVQHLLRRAEGILSTPKCIVQSAEMTAMSPHL